MKDKLAIIVPYRDREEHLNVFVPHMHEFLKDKGIDYTIFIAEQSDDRPFNYGKLCNVVTKEIGEEYTYFAFHDIDMLPISDECDYSYPDSPTHLATNVEAHDNKLPYPQYFGGVVLINREDFENANGYSNEYWGYGFQDLDLLYRLQRSGAYLEKYYDLNQTYSKYDKNDILPYRIENVKLSNNFKRHKIKKVSFDLNTRLYGTINEFTNFVIQDEFSISIWFNDNGIGKYPKNIFSFEGNDTGLFLSETKYLIAQIWDYKNNHYELSGDYYQNKWNHVVFSYKNGTITLWLNNKKIKTEFFDNFNVYDYRNHSIKISDKTSEIDISSVIVFENKITDDVVSDLYYNGIKSLDLIKNKYGYSISNFYTFSSIYKNKFILDSGKNLNHLKIEGNIPSITDEIIYLTDEIYLPIRLNGEYSSLIHENDTDIIENYYIYNPDIEENADIFFHEVITNKLDYKSIGLSTIKYTLLDTQERNGYELIRIVT
jgi:hypothetical protein